ncbi:MAG: glycine cleavage system protein H [Planctomycetia bacterium]
MNDVRPYIDNNGPSLMPMETIRFRHAHFSARFPVGYRYAASHFWIAPADAVAAIAPDGHGGIGLWRVGFTKFATRMLGELVEMTLDVAPGARVASGQRLGVVEGFKAVSDLYCVMDGAFVGTNPALSTEACLTHSDPYLAGWLYQVEGVPTPETYDVHGYIAILTETIDRLQASRYDGGDGSPA